MHLPSPIAHTVLGYVVYRAARRQPALMRLRLGSKLPLLLVVTALVSLLPDLDAIPGLISGDFASFHNQASHSLFAGLFAALLVGWLLGRITRTGFTGWFWVTFASYQLHVLADAFTQGRGVMLLWPFSEQRFQSPLLLFVGVRWDAGLFSSLHLVTLASELVFALAIIALVSLRERRLCGLCLETEAGD